MDDAPVTLASNYVRHIAAFLDEEAIPGWLADVGLSVAGFDDDTVTLSFGDLERLLLGAVALAKEPALGLFLGERLEARTHGFVGFAALHSRTLGDVLDVLVRYVPVRLSLITTAVVVRGEEVRLEVNAPMPLLRIERPLLEAVLMSIRNVLDAVSLGAFTIDALVFPFAAPDYAALAKDLARTDVRYGQTWAGLVMRKDALDVPLKLADPEVFRAAERICQRRLDELDANALMSTRVRRLLLRHESGVPSQVAVARRLHLTPRTLHRRLVDEGTSYRRLVDEVRFRLASDHLIAGRASVDEIAYMLGYTNTSNFRRAFRRWAGKSPGAFRAFRAL